MTVGEADAADRRGSDQSGALDELAVFVVQTLGESLGIMGKCVLDLIAAKDRISGWRGLCRGGRFLSGRVRNRRTLRAGGGEGSQNEGGGRPA
jgi:hypothetical protein